MTATTRTVTLSREAGGVAGLAWAYFAALARGSRSASEATGILATFREVFGENRSAVVDALVQIGGREADVEGVLPRTLRPSSTQTPDDASALALSVYPICVLGRAEGETGWGTARELLDLFMAVPQAAAGTRDWFLDNLASVWPQGTANARGRLLWWFATNVRSAETASRFFVQYVFQGAGTTGDGPSTGPSSMQEAAAALLGGDAASTDAGAEAEALEVGPETRITAPRSTGRSAWFYLVWVGLFLAVGGTSVWLWSYNRRYGRMPWQGR